MHRNAPHVLLVNPWIHDFAAYDFWARPLGLLYLAALLRLHDIPVQVIDCLDRFHPKAASSDPRARCGRGPYLKTPIPPPPGLGDIRRRYSRYGIPPEWMRETLVQGPSPDLIMVTSLMTYWYPGVQESIAVIREVFPDTPLVLGGVYATLCPEHARAIPGVDRVFTGEGMSGILDLVREITGYGVEMRFRPDQPDTYPFPALDACGTPAYVPILTSIGCPFSCAYCASHYLNPAHARRSPEHVVEEIVYWHRRFGVRDFVFYDDALLMDPERHIIPVLESVLQQGLGLRFHTPNAVHIRYLTGHLARLMQRSGFKTLRLGLETTHFSPERRMDRKVTEAEFQRVARHLNRAGFSGKQVGAYLLTGLPGQSVDELAAAIRTVLTTGITPILAYYTPIPHTSLWEAAVAASRYDLNADPIYTNNAIMPCWPEEFSWRVLSDLKALIRSGAPA